MGCLVKKVNKKFVGFVLLCYLDVIEDILKVVVNVVNVLVIFKIWMGWDIDNKNCFLIV